MNPHTFTTRAVVFFFCLLNALSLYGATFRAIVLADTASNLANSARKDVNSLKEALQKICTKTGLELSMDLLDGYSLEHHNVCTLITAPNNNDADVLLFYYTGHGFHPPKSTSPLPTIMLSMSQEALDTRRICEQLSGFRARLTIVLFDCCNSTIDINVIQKSLSSNNSKRTHSRILRKLFLKTSGTIIAAASQTGHTAYAFKEGSLFTKTLLNNLFYSNKSNDDSWPAIFDRIAFQCQPYQTPYVFFDL